jgi:integrase
MRNSNCLSARKIARLTTPGRYPDGRVPGLLFQISRNGGRSWVLRYRLNSRERMLGLGRIELVSVDYARERAKAAWRQILDGIDPIDLKHARRRGNAPNSATIPFKEAASRYIDAHRAGWRNDKHAAQWESTLETYAYPTIGDLAVDRIETSHMMEVLQQDYDGAKLWTSRTETASRVRQRIEAILDWAKVSGFRSGDNPARWRGHLDKLLPARAKVARRRHQPALPYTDLPAFMADLRKREGVSTKALEFTILTAARTNEVTKARRSEIDWKEKIWIVPPERMKAGREHRVPLTERAVKLLESLPVEVGNDFLFIGAEAGKPISNAAMAESMKRMAPPSTTAGKIATVHGMRSTFRDWAAERTNFPRELAEAALAHVLDSKVERAYQRGDLLARRRKLMEAWAAYCASPVRSGEVVPMRKVDRVKAHVA